VTRQIDLRVDNGAITLLVDGNQVLSATDSSPLTNPGTGGIWAGSYAQFQTVVYFKFMIRASFEAGMRPLRAGSMILRGSNDYRSIGVSHSQKL